MVFEIPIPRKNFDTFVNYTGSMAAYLTPAKSDARTRLLAAWNAALDRLIADPKLGTDDRLVAVNACLRKAALAILVVSLGTPIDASAASLSASTFTPIKAPECITDPSTAFFSENVAPAVPPHPSLPSEHFYIVARYLGDDAIAAAASFDYSRFPVDYAWPPARGEAITGFSVPDPKPVWQRAHSFTATMDTSSAFQIYCRDAGSFINTWTYPPQTITGGGAHTIYGYSFNNPPPPAIYDASPGTDFVLQAVSKSRGTSIGPTPHRRRNRCPSGK